MARCALPLGAAVFVSALVLLPLVAVLWRADGFTGLRAGDWAAIRFSLTQAFLSALISVFLAIPVARALARRSFPGRGLLITLLGAPFILPVIVAVLGLLAVFGKNGILSQLLVFFGGEPLSIYGLHGVVLAHVFFNLPLATRLVLQEWLSIPAERFRLAATLGLDGRGLFRVLEQPVLRRSVPGAFVVVFVLCLSSFAVALTLGGGPGATTVELAIYQAFRFDFDLGHAAVLALVQLAMAVTAGALALRFALGGGAGTGLDRRVMRWDSQGVGARVLDWVSIVCVALFLSLPLAMVVLRGAPAVVGLPGVVWQAAAYSVAVALASTVLCLMLALPLACRYGGIVGLLGLAVSPLALGTGLFLLVRPYASPGDLAMMVTALVNALMSLPFAIRALNAPVQSVADDFGRLAQSVGLTGWRYWTRVALPRLRRPMGFAAGLSAALSMGDLGVVALFGDPNRATLPLQMYRLMGSYQMEAAAGAALVLLVLSLGLFWVFDRGGRHAEA